MQQRKTAINLPAKVAVVTRTRNRPLFLRRVLHCMARQVYRDWVHVIVNDGGKPQTVEAIVAGLSKEQHAKTRVFHHHVPKGGEAAANTGMRSAFSEYLVVLDDDDTWSPHFLDACVAFLDADENQDYGGVVTRTSCVSELLLGGRLVPIGRKLYNPTLTSVGFAEMLNKRLFTQNAFVFRRSCQEQIGFFREDFCVLGDWEYDLRFTNQFRIGVVKRVLANHHMRMFVHDGVACNQTTIAGMEPFSHFTRMVRTEWREVAEPLGINVDALDERNLDPTFLMRHETDQRLERLIEGTRQCWKRLRELFRPKTPLPPSHPNGDLPPPPPPNPTD